MTLFSILELRMDTKDTADELLNDTGKAIKGKLRDDWENFTDKQRLAVLAMLVSSNDKQAMATAHITGRHFYRIKAQIQPHLDEIKRSITDKAYNILAGSVLRAAEIMNEALEAPSLSYRMKSAESILDRVLGKPTQRTEIKSKNAVTVLNINASVEEIEALKKPLSPLDNSSQSA